MELYRDPQQAVESVPLLRLLNTPLQQLRERGQAIAAAIESAAGVRRAKVIDEQSYLGGGSVPTQQQSTVCIAITPQASGVDAFAAALRASHPAIIGRIRKQRLLLDLRTVFPGQDAEIVAAIRSIPPPVQPS